MAEADLERAQLDCERLRELVEAKMVAQQDFDHADAAFKAAEAALEVARQKVSHAQVDAARGKVVQALVNLRQAELNLEYATVRASRSRCASSRARIHAISWSPACRSSPPSNFNNILGRAVRWPRSTL